MRIRNVLRNKKGEATILMVALILGLLLLMCAMAEFFRLSIIVQGVRDGLQQSVITVATTNYDETYNGLREGYSGGYVLSGDRWQENLDYDDVLARMGTLVGADMEGGTLTKWQPEGYEYRLSELDVEIVNTPLTPGNTNKNFEADARITIEIPLSFGWSMVPPLKMEVRTRAAYMPKF